MYTFLEDKQPLGFLCGLLGLLIALPAYGVLRRQRPIPRPAKERLDCTHLAPAPRLDPVWTPSGPRLDPVWAPPRRPVGAHRRLINATTTWLASLHGWAWLARQKTDRTTCPGGSNEMIYVPDKMVGGMERCAAGW